MKKLQNYNKTTELRTTTRFRLQALHTDLFEHVCILAYMKARAMQLLSINEENGHFQIIPDALDIIARTEGPVSVVMIAGGFLACLCVDYLPSLRSKEWHAVGSRSS